ncbi:EexN family lipoprotein [Bartonella krasnovii]|uniref:EexN family lipoprotein n=1 Tax=Bartonella krasnovii TaxID=2267275 RepID=UPI001F4C7CDF|nr:EexN family lipoprotein [Bartonella krasnovii]UNF45228.1 EexN family lipoprotein [Bartonella krasnovii]UNF51823.1 EexN family lipoprotein [Bartonella krasnovii]
MNKIIITTLLLCTGIIAAGCEKTYSVAEFKKDKKLMEEWGARCGFTGTSKNCENLRVAALELQKEYEAKAEERIREQNEGFHDAMKKFKAEMEADLQKRRAEREARERAKAEREAKEKAEQQQDTH